jgi:hypothetical protein
LSEPDVRRVVPGAQASARQIDDTEMLMDE